METSQEMYRVEDFTVFRQPYTTPDGVKTHCVVIRFAISSSPEERTTTSLPFLLLEPPMAQVLATGLASELLHLGLPPTAASAQTPQH